ncbi:hypothetical protein M426DRAFT_18716 [Hypoxylon sp. CI-4A]|nr:hypothetical protein M426DRAFT_18716 [Hypoxylon sp. CI-4A]
MASDDETAHIKDHPEMGPDLSSAPSPADQADNSNDEKPVPDVSSLAIEDEFPDQLPRLEKRDTMMRKATEVWEAVGHDRKAAIDAFFGVEYMGMRIEPFEGLPVWAVPTPKDFNPGRHLSGMFTAPLLLFSITTLGTPDRQQIEQLLTFKLPEKRLAPGILCRRVTINVEVDPSPAKAWVKAVPDDKAMSGLNDVNRRYETVFALWEFYHFLCFWSVQRTRTGRCLSLLKALNLHLELRFQHTHQEIQKTTVIIKHRVREAADEEEKAKKEEMPVDKKEGE